MFACTICESVEHRASDHAAAVAAQAAAAADLIARPASLVYEVAEPADFVEPCSLCESTGHLTRDHAEAMLLRAQQAQAALLGGDYELPVAGFASAVALLSTAAAAPSASAE